MADCAAQLLAATAAGLAAYLRAKHPRLGRLRQLGACVCEDVQAALQAQAAFQDRATQSLTMQLAAAE